jgi:hypothetical protein
MPRLAEAESPRFSIHELASSPRHHRSHLAPGGAADMSQHKDYLGDGVYVDFENDMIRLTTEDGISVLAGPIYLDKDVLVALGRYCGRMGIFGSPTQEKPA